MQSEDLLARLEAALAGGPAVIVGEPPERAVPADAALVVRTSGSTSGRGRPVPLTTAGLLASARATEARLAGPGQWLLALPPGHIAGLQVLSRSVVAGTTPVVLGRGEDLAAAVGRLRTDVPRYASIVPTQLVRALSPRSRDDLAALARLDAVLVGGSAIDPRALTTARVAGVPVVTTYGMTETAGGCVYDGRPLDDVRLRLADSVVELSGPMLTPGYLDDGPQPFVLSEGRRWFRTSDLGRIADGRLELLGRVDDVLISGGVNVHPVAVERAITTDPTLGVSEACVVGRPSAEWGSEVGVVVVTAAPIRSVRPDAPGHFADATDAADTAAALLDGLRARVKAEISPAAAPRALWLRESLPLRGPGKVDRRTAACWAAATEPDARHRR